MARYSLSNKVVPITGSGRGLGAATATVLAQRGARVVLADIDGSAAQRVAATLPNSRGLALTCDVTDIDSVQEAVRRTREEFGRIDVVIANAGVLGCGGTFRTLTPDQVSGVMSVNVDGVVNTVAATLESVISSRGQIVLVSSVFAYLNGAGAIPTSPGLPASTASTTTSSSETRSCGRRGNRIPRNGMSNSAERQANTGF
jgi:NAD(P)-dependent dehydrogenase (short-subunit alcohol dehydrogenase family)